MKQKTGKILASGILVLGLVFGLNMATQGMELTKSEKSRDISLDTLHSINSMSTSSSFESSSSDEVSPRIELESQDQPQHSKTQDISSAAADQMKTTQKNNSVTPKDKTAADYLPEATNDCGFYCGRSQICYPSCCNDRKLHPKDECACCLGIDLYCCIPVVSLIDFAGILSGIFWPCSAGAKVNGGCLCTVTTCSVTIAAAGATALCACYPLIGHAPYVCAQCMNKQEFSDSFERGKMCLPEDACSPTSLWTGFNHFWDPCCGKSIKKA